MKLGHNADDLKINIFCLIRKSNQNELLQASAMHVRNLPTWKQRKKIPSKQHC